MRTLRIESTMPPAFMRDKLNSFHFLV